MYICQTYYDSFYKKNINIYFCVKKKRKTDKNGDLTLISNIEKGVFCDGKTKAKNGATARQ